jgi:hypothetical protein
MSTPFESAVMRFDEALTALQTAALELEAMHEGSEAGPQREPREAAQKLKERRERRIKSCTRGCDAQGDSISCHALGD